MQSNRMTIKARVRRVSVDSAGYIWMALGGCEIPVNSAVAFCPEEVPPGMTPLGLASFALGHKVEIDLTKCGDSSFAIVALRFSEKTQAARVLRLAAEILPRVARGNWHGAFTQACLVASVRVQSVAEEALWEHFKATGRRGDLYGVQWHCFKGLHSADEVDSEAWMKEQIAALMTVADQLDEENDGDTD